MKPRAFQIHRGPRPDIRRLAQYLVVLFLAPAPLIEPRARAATVSWIVDADGSWTTASNWSSNPSLPGPSDDVIISQPGFDTITLSNVLGTQTINSLVCNEALQLTSGAELSLAANSQINGALTLTAGTLSGAGDLTIGGTFNWIGTLAAGGKTTLTTTSLTTIGNSSGAVLSRILENSGIVNFTPASSSVTLSLSGGTLNNLSGGTFNYSDGLSSGPTTTISSQGASSFSNAGTFNYSAFDSQFGVPQSRTFAAPFNNSGLANIYVGTLALSGGGSNSGTINVYPGGKLAFNTASFHNSGTLNFTGSAPSSGFTTLDPSSFTNDPGGQVNVLSGGLSLTGSGANLGHFNISQSATLTLNSMTLCAFSSLTGAGNVTLGNISSFSGIVNVSGSVTVTGAVTFVSDQSIAAAATINGGTITGPANISFSGPVTWGGDFGGSMSGTGKTTLTPTCVATLGVYSETLNRTLDNAGTLNYAPVAYSLAFGSSGVLNNLAGATFNLTSSSTNTVTPFTGTAGSAINNAGTLNLTGAASNSGQSKFSNSVPISNSGTLNITLGTLQQNGAALTNAGTINLLPGGNLAGNSIINSGALNFQGGTSTFLIGQFTNTASGHVNIQSGSVTLSGANSNSGSINISPGAQLSITDNYQQLAGSSITGAGSVTLGNITNFAGTFGVTGPITINNPVTFTTDQTLSGAVSIRGNVSGSGNLTFSNSFIWTSGVLSGSGKITIPNGASGTINNFVTLSRQMENAGTLTLTPQPGLGLGMAFTGGTLTNLPTGTLSVFGTASPMNFSNSGSNSLINAGTMNLRLITSSSATGTLTEAVPFTNSGTLNLNPCIFSLTGGGTNSGTINIYSGSAFTAVTQSFTNTGNINYLSGTNSLTVSSQYNNAAAGHINVLSGTLTIAGTGATNTGNFNIAAGATLQINSDYTQSASSSITGAGTLILSSAISNFAGALNSTGPVQISAPITFNADQNLVGTTTLSSTLSGTGDVLLTGPFVWPMGMMSGGGKTILPVGHILDLSGSSNRTLDGRTLANSGTINFSTGQFTESNGAAIDNRSTGVFDLQGDYNIAAGTGSMPTFTNAGLLKKSSGGGTATVPWALSNSNTGIVQVQSGNLAIGGFVNSGTLIVGSGATLTVPAGNALTNIGSIQGSGTIAAAVQSSGTISPGASPGTLSFNGDLTLQNGAQAVFELAGTQPGTQYDHVAVSGNLALNGGLQVSFASGFQSQVQRTDTFDLFTATGTVSGALDVASGSRVFTTDGIGSFLLSYPAEADSKSVALSDFLARGDFNGDKAATAADISFMLQALSDLSRFQSTNSLADGELTAVGDLDGSGSLNNADVQSLATLIANISAANLSNSTAQPVPEPPAFTLAATLFLVLAGIIFVRAPARSRIAIGASIGLILLLAALVGIPARAATVSWAVDGDGLWTTALNWSSNPSLPGPGDDVVISQPGFDRVTLSSTAVQSINSLICGETLQIASGAQLSLAADSQINGTLALTGEDGTNGFTGGTLSGTGNLTVTGAFIWNGRLVGGGKTTLASTCVTTLTSSRLGRTVDNYGTINYIPPFDVGVNFNTSTAVLNNLAGAIFTVTNPNSSISVTAFTGVSGSAINNSGMFSFVGAAGSLGQPRFNSSVPINNSGTMSITLGTLAQSAGVTNGGIINFLPGGNLTETQGNTIANSGTVNFQGGTTTFSINQFINTASGHVNIQSGSVTLSGANSNSGSIDVSAGAQLTITDNYQQLAGSSITGAGSVTLGNITNFAGNLAVTGPVTINNPIAFTADQVFAGPTVVASAGGSVSGSGNLTFNKSFTWNTGTLSGSGKITIASAASGAINVGSFGSPTLAKPIENAGTLTITQQSAPYSLGFSSAGSLTNLATGTLNVFGSASTFTFGSTNGGGSLVNAGTMNLTLTPPSGAGKLTENAAFTNSGTFNLYTGTFAAVGGGINTGTINVYPGSNFTTLDVFSGTPSYTNAGTINYFAGTNSLSVASPTFNNAAAGHINILGGSLTIGVLNGTNNGNLNVAAGATLRLSSDYAQSATATITGPGTLVLSFPIHNFSGALSSTGPLQISAPITFNTDQTFAGTTTLMLGSGFTTIDGPGNILLTGTLNWISSAMGGTGETTLPVDHVLDLSGAAKKELLGRTFINLGTTNLGQGVNFAGNNGATFNNQSGAIFDSIGDGNLTWTVGTQPTFNNAGLFRKSAGTGVTSVAWVFNNTGTVEVFSGTLSLAGGGNHSGNFDVAAGATLGFAGGTHSLSGGAAITGAGAVSVSGGTLNVGGDFTNSTTLTVGSGATLSLSPGNTLTNTGLIKGAGTIVANMQSSGVVSPGSSPGALHITGNFNELATGLLNMEIAGTTPGTQYDQLFVTGDLTLSGALQVTFIDGFLPTAGQEFDLLQTGGTFTPPASLDFTNAPPGFEYSTTFTGGVFSIDIISVPEPSAFTLAAALFSALAVASRRIAHWRSA
jgi:fibronectin-binding autotransporter adhesin